jgi:cell division GTPase FtsZ
MILSSKIFNIRNIIIRRKIMAEKLKNRVVVVDESGDVTKVKSDAEIAEENKKLEEALKPKLDPNVLKKLKKKTKKEEKVKAIAKRDRSLYFGVVGLGQCGNRLAETFHELGYESCAFNTATQDLEYIKLPENKKIFLPLALGGAGKILENGEKAIEQNAELILDKLNENFDDSNEMIFICSSGSGGTGSGGIESMIKLVSKLDKPIGVIYVLPMESEDALGKHNSVVTLGKLAKMASTDQITTLIIVDNLKVELIYPGLSKAEFWPVANKAIVEPLHLFNHLSSMASEFDSLDPMDFGNILTAGDCGIYGMIEIENYMETTAIAESIIENLETGLLASDFDLKETRFGGFIVVADGKILKKLPAVNIDYANHVINEKCDSPSLFRGVYEMDINKDVVRIYTLFTGLGLPAPRIEFLKTQAADQMKIVNKKEQSRSDKMNVDYGAKSDSETKAQEIHKIIKQKKSSFGKLTANAGRIIDRRKR